MGFRLGFFSAAAAAERAAPRFRVKYRERRFAMRRCGLLTILVLLGCVDSSASETAPPDAPAYSRRVWRSADGLPEDFAQSLAQTQDGYLWIGTSGGLARFDGVSFVVFNRENTPAMLDD